MFKGIVKKLVATAVVAASAFLAVVFLGVAIFYALSLTLTPLGAAAVTFGLFALVALIVTLVFLKGDNHDDAEEEDEPEGLLGKVIHIVRERPIVGAVGGLGAAFLLLRNPALAAIVASMVADRKMDQGGYSRRRRR
jgi:membrane protein implicated in regulation of membrane protease activity